MVHASLERVYDDDWKCRLVRRPNEIIEKPTEASRTSEEDLRRLRISFGNTYRPIPRYLLHNWNTYREDEFVRHEDTLRSANGYYYTKEEVALFKEKSHNHCPIYGSCDKCFRAGPVGKFCDCCGFDHGYAVLRLTECLYDPQHSGILDSLFVANYLRRGCEQAIAVQLHTRVYAPYENIMPYTIHLAANTEYTRRQSNREHLPMTRTIFAQTLWAQLIGVHDPTIARIPIPSMPTQPVIGSFERFAFDEARARHRVLLGTPFNIPSCVPDRIMGADKDLFDFVERSSITAGLQQGPMLSRTRKRLIRENIERYRLMLIHNCSHAESWVHFYELHTPPTPDTRTQSTRSTANWGHSIMSTHNDDWGHGTTSDWGDPVTSDTTDNWTRASIPKNPQLDHDSRRRCRSFSPSPSRHDPRVPLSDEDTKPPAAKRSK